MKEIGLRLKRRDGGPALVVTKWPDRKLPTLCIEEGAQMAIMATFKSDRAAHAFQEWICSILGEPKDD